jgi:dolichol-phosphate mannosyltransferase
MAERRTSRTGIKRSRGRHLARLDVVVPIFNEAKGLADFHASLMRVLLELPYACRVIYVDDGSTDRSAEVITGLPAPGLLVECLRLSRNFGHQAALTAGLDRADADVVITMDGDGEHPPAAIPEMLALLASGCDIVLAVRRSAGEASAFKRLTRRVFYRLLGMFSDTEVIPGAADFRLLSSKAVHALRSMGDYHRYLRGMVAWLGFTSAVVHYDTGTRIAGASKYSIRKMARLGMEAMFSFSLVPVYLCLLAGVLFLLMACAEAAWVAIVWLTRGGEGLAPGWSSLMFVSLVMGGVLVLSIGTVGVYVGLIYQQVKHRPVYILKEEHVADETDG